MYLEYFGLKTHPFGLNADPYFVYPSEAHKRVRAYIQYALSVRDSLLVITGEIGAGKTTLINEAVSKLDPRFTVARMHQTQLDETELLQAVLGEFRIPGEFTSKVKMLQVLREFLRNEFRRGKQAVLIIDEAQHLSLQSLEEIRLIADTEFNGTNLVTVILVGQPELKQKLEDPSLEQLTQRVRLCYHLNRLRHEEVGPYIEHRLRTAGAANQNLFDSECLHYIYQYSGGALRLINILCDYALVNCYVENQKHVTAAIVRKCVDELNWESWQDKHEPEEDATRVMAIRNMEKSVVLRVEQNGDILREIKLTEGPVKIGRHPDNDVVLDHQAISRFHAEVIDRNGKWYVRDLNSMNGTRVSGQRVDLHPLIPGDQFEIGVYRFSYLNESGARTREYESQFDLLHFSGKPVHH